MVRAPLLASEIAERVRESRKPVKILVTSDGEHSPLGPSSAKRWLNCPGSVRATRDVPDKSSTYAISGTAAHHLSDTCRKFGVPPSKYLDWEIHVRRGKETSIVKIDQAMVDSVQYFIDYVNELPGQQFFEARVQYERYVKKGFGTMDHASVEKIIHIVDFKDGQGIQVYAPGNYQLMLYALGFYEDFGWALDISEDLVFRLHIVQPRLDHVDFWDISLKDLLHWAETTVRPGALRTEDEDAPIVPGPWCADQFCRIRHTCEARANMILTDAVGEFENLDELENKVADLPYRLAHMSNDDIAKIMNAADGIAAFLKDIKAHAMSEIQQGRAVGDWKLVAGRSPRSWALDDLAMAQVLLEAKLSEDQIWKKKIITAPAAEKLLGKKHRIMVTHVRKPPGVPKLAPGCDKRPALAEDALREFGNLDGDEPSEEE